MATKLPLTRAAYQRKLIAALREPAVEKPTAPNWPAERAMLADRARTPGVKVTHILDAPREWRVRALVDRVEVGDEVTVRRKRDLDAAVDVALETARKAIRDSGAPISGEVYGKKVFA